MRCCEAGMCRGEHDVCCVLRDPALPEAVFPRLGRPPGSHRCRTCDHKTVNRPNHSLGKQSTGQTTAWENSQQAKPQLGNTHAYVTGVCPYPKHSPYPKHERTRVYINTHSAYTTTKLLRIEPVTSGQTHILHSRSSDTLAICALQPDSDVPRPAPQERCRRRWRGMAAGRLG